MLLLLFRCAVAVVVADAVVSLFAESVSVCFPRDIVVLSTARNRGVRRRRDSYTICALYYLLWFARGVHTHARW